MNCGILRSDIVFYGEQMNSAVVNNAIRSIESCDLLIVGGTSLAVYPAVGLIDYRRGAKLALINQDETPCDRQADLVMHESIAVTLDEAIPM